MKHALWALAVLPALACGEEPAGPAPGSPAQVVVSLGHRCLAKSGRVWCWGSDIVGQAGQGVSLEAGRPDPLPVPGLDGVVELAASDAHTCARLQDGKVSCWGANGHGESAPQSAPVGTCKQFLFDAGEVDVACAPTPTLVPGLDDARQLALNDQRSCARRATGAVRCWGQSARGADWAAARFGVQQLAIGDQKACVGQADGTLACSGGQPATIQTWTGVEQLAMAARSDLSCVRHAGGQVNCWAENSAGQRGIGTTDPMIPLPEDPPALAGGSSAIAVGWGHVCALVEGGAVYCWGRNGTGAVGLSVGATRTCSAGPCQLRPRKVEGLPPVVSLAAGGDSTCALTAEDRLYCWGEIQGRDNDGVPTHVPGPWESR